MDVAVAGKLKLKKKGGSGISKKTTAKPSAATSRKAAEAAAKAIEESKNKDVGESSDSIVKPMAPPQKTKAELAFQKRYQQMLDKRVKEKAQLSHREKVEQFNQKIGSMSEFNDIPKVSWTK